MACTTVQTFCSSCQSVGEHVIFNGKKGFSFSNSTEKKNKATSNFINEAISALETIHNFGKEGTKKPSATDIQSLQKVSSKNKITTKEYNLLLSVLEVRNKEVQSKTRLLGSYFSDLENYINDFELHSTLCDSCNAECQSGQSCSQDSGGCDSTCERQCQSNCEGHVGCSVCDACICSQTQCNVGCQCSNSGQE